MPTFSRFGILNLRRPHDRSSRPPGMPSPGEVEAGGLGREEAKKKVRLAETKGMRSAGSARFSLPSTTRFGLQT